MRTNECTEPNNPHHFKIKKKIFSTSVSLCEHPHLHIYSFKLGRGRKVYFEWPKGHESNEFNSSKSFCHEMYHSFFLCSYHCCDAQASVSMRFAATNRRATQSISSGQLSALPPKRVKAPLISGGVYAGDPCRLPSCSSHVSHGTALGCARPTAVAPKDGH